ncbi:MAG: glycosyltransferase [Candidatus Omnitrophica bacterium]|nr:glycosyltransferase [Candidatus Omnitrophota bacterium]
MKIAIVHDWLFHMRGGEKVLDALYEIFPEADLYTLFYRRKKLSPRLAKAPIRASFLQFFPGITAYYRWLLPFLPFVVETLGLKGYDVVISSSHCVAKGCRPPAGALHICYCHTPARYVWGFQEDYFGHWPSWLRRLSQFFLESFKKWDLANNRRVDYFIANSRNTARRIAEFYGRETAVIYPPCDSLKLIADSAGDPEGGNYYLIVSALVPYKRVDLAVRAFNELGLSLRIVGDGPEAGKLRAAAGPSIEFLGPLSDAELRRQYSGCRALIFPGEEDFGIVPVEAQACGRPVIAYSRGGALETVSGGTGVFFSDPTPAALGAAVRRFETLPFHAPIIREHARQFDRAVFQRKIQEAVRSLCVDKAASMATK